MNRQLIVLSALLLGLVVAGPRLVAQSTPAPQQSADSPEKANYRGPLPFYFGKLGLSNQQKESMYSVMDEYEKKLAALREQILQTEKERDQKLEAMLTPGQKLRLAELREEARKETEARQKRREQPEQP